MMPSLSTLVLMLIVVVIQLHMQGLDAKKKCAKQLLTDTRIGHDYRRVRRPNADSCYEKCLNDTRCGAVTYEVKTRKCFVMRPENYVFLTQSHTDFVTFICQDRTLISPGKPTESPGVDYKDLRLANDGFVYPDDLEKCLHTTTYWEVDLLYIYKVSAVQIYGPRKTIGAMGNTIIEVRKQSPPYEECSRQGSRDQHWYYFQGFLCNPRIGSARYVRIRPLDEKPLVLCEVEIFGQLVLLTERMLPFKGDGKVPGRYAIFKLNRIRNNSSEDAICRDQCHTYQLVGTKIIDMVEVTNVMISNGYHMYPLRVTISDIDEPWKECTRYNMVSGTRMTYHFGCGTATGMTGHFVRLELPEGHTIRVHDVRVFGRYLTDEEEKTRLQETRKVLS